MSAHEDITTHSGFGSWMSTFTPADTDRQGDTIGVETTRPVEELPAYVHELPANNVQTAVELDSTPVHIPAPRPQLIPQPVRPPQPHPMPVPVRRKRDSELHPPMYQPMKDSIRTVQVHGLEKIGASGKFTETVQVSHYGTLAHLNTAIRRLGQFMAVPCELY